MEKKRQQKYAFFPFFLLSCVVCMLYTCAMYTLFFFSSNNDYSHYHVLIGSQLKRFVVNLILTPICPVKNPDVKVNRCWECAFATLPNQYAHLFDFVLYGFVFEKSTHSMNESIVHMYIISIHNRFRFANSRKMCVKTIHRNYFQLLQGWVRPYIKFDYIFSLDWFDKRNPPFIWLWNPFVLNLTEQFYDLLSRILEHSLGSDHRFYWWKWKWHF